MNYLVFSFIDDLIICMKRKHHDVIVNVKVTLFNAHCLSFYTCSLCARFTKRAYDSLRVPYNNVFRVM